MSKSLLLSIKPKYCELIANGKKTVEARKTRPKLETPFKVYIYCTKGEYIWKDKERVFLDGKYNRIIDNMPECLLNGKVIGEFVCKAILPISITYSDTNSRLALREFPYTCLTDKEIMDYLGNGKTGYGWHISDLIIYDKPKDLSDFYKPCVYGEESDVSCFLCDKSGYRPDMHIDCFNKVTRPPQSWCYVEKERESNDE